MFIPANEAFKSVKESDLFKLLGNPAAMKKSLMSRIVNGTYFLSGLTKTMDLPSLTGGVVKIVVNGDSEC